MKKKQKTEPSIVRGFRLKPSLLEKLQEIADKQKRKLNGLVAIVLDDYSKKNFKQKK